MQVMSAIYLSCFGEDALREVMKDFRKVAELSLILLKNVAISVDSFGNDANFRNWETYQRCSGSCIRFRPKEHQDYMQDINIDLLLYIQNITNKYM